MKKLVIATEYSHEREWLSTIPAIFDSEGRTIYESRNMVKAFEHGGETFVVKRYKKPNAVQRFAYTLYRPSKAKRAFLFAERLLKLGIDTPKPIAFIETRSCGIFSYGFFISDSNPLPDCTILRQQTIEGMEAALGKFLVRLHDCGFMHGDLNLTNILYRQDKDSSYHFALIDLNRSHFSENPTKAEIHENLKRLAHDRDLLSRLLKRYAQARGWDEAETVASVTALVEKFERKKSRINKLKRLFKK